MGWSPAPSNCPLLGQEEHVKKSELLAFLDFARDNRDALQIVKDFETAKEIVLVLAKEGVEELELLERCRHINYANKLVDVLLAWAVESRRWQPMLDALAKLPKSWWEETEFRADDLYCLLRGHEILNYLLHKHADMIRDQDHPLFSRGGTPTADDYWLHQARRFIVRCDFRRAWDEIEKADRGFIGSWIKQEDYRNPKDYIEDCSDRRNRCWSASTETIKLLLNELYSAMRQVGAIRDLTEADRVFAAYNRPPGSEMVARFVSSRVDCGQFLMEPEGGMALVLARHFQQLRNAHRAEKNAKKLREYEHERNKQ